MNDFLGSFHLRKKFIPDSLSTKPTVTWVILIIYCQEYRFTITSQITMILVNTSKWGQKRQIKSEASCVQSCPTLLSHGLQTTRPLCPWNFSDKNSGVGCHFLLQRIFQTQESNPCLLCWQADSLPLGHMGSPLMT